MNRTGPASRAALLASKVVALAASALAAAGCDSSPGPQPSTSVPVPVPAIAGSPAETSPPLPAPKPPAPVVPAGPVRLREASLGAAVLLAGALWDLPILALDTTPEPATFAIAGRGDVGAALAAAYRTSSASSKELLVLAPEPRAAAAVAAAARGPGRDVDLRLEAAPGLDLIRLLGDVERLTVAGELGGSFALALHRFPARRLLAVMAAACGATLSIRGKVARIEGSQCSSSPAPPPAPSPPSLDDRALPGAPIDEIRLAGLGVDGPRRLAVLAHGRTVAVIAPGAVVGDREPRCEKHWLASREESPEHAAVVEAIRRREALWIDQAIPKNQEEMARRRSDEEAATRAVDEARAAEAAALEQRKAARPAWCAADRGELVWKVEAIDGEGVTFAPVLDPGGRPSSLAPAPGVEPRRLPIAD